jgi:hypothetical protein
MDRQTDRQTKFNPVGLGYMLLQNNPITLVKCFHHAPAQKWLALAYKKVGKLLQALSTPCMHTQKWLLNFA